MRFVRSGRRVAVAAVSLSALLVAAACGSSSTGAGSGTGSSAPAVDFTKQGDIELWQGKDVSGNLPKLIAQFNSQHPNGQVTLHELPDSADQQRQQMIQNTQIKNPAMGVISVDVVWTSEFAAKGYVVPLPADQFPTDGLPAVRRRLGAPTSTSSTPTRRPPTAACCTTARTCSTSTASPRRRRPSTR